MLPAAGEFGITAWTMFSKNMGKHQTLILSIRITFQGELKVIMNCSRWDDPCKQEKNTSSHYSNTSIISWNFEDWQFPITSDSRWHHVSRGVKKKLFLIIRERRQFTQTRPYYLFNCLILFHYHLLVFGWIPAKNTFESWSQKIPLPPSWETETS